MEFIILVVLLVLLILVGSIVMGFFYAWCCSQPFVQQIHSEYLDYEKNRMNWNERQLPTYFGTDQSSVAASNKQENEKLLKIEVGDDTICTEPDKPINNTSGELEEKLNPTNENNEISETAAAAADSSVVMVIPDDVPITDNHEITVSVDVENQKHR